MEIPALQVKEAKRTPKMITSVQVGCPQNLLVGDMRATVVGVAVVEMRLALVQPNAVAAVAAAVDDVLVEAMVD